MMALACALLAPGACGARRARAGDRDQLVRGTLMLSLEDSDLPPGAYADGRLASRDPDASDTLTVLQLPVPQAGGRRERAMEAAQIPVSNSALGSDAALALSRDGTRALVATTHAPAPPGAQRVEDLPVGSSVRLIDVVSWPARVLDTIEIAPAPVAVAFHPEGRLAAVACRATRRLVLLEIGQQRFSAAVFIDLAGALGFDCEPSGVAWSPDGRLLCVTTGAPGSMVFFRVDLSTIATPVVAQVGRTLRFGAYLRSPHWTLDSRRVVVADAGWPSAASGVYLLEPQGGTFLVRAPEGDGDARLLHSAPMAPAPHAIALDPAGRTVASVAMRREDLFAGSAKRGGVVTTLRVMTDHVEVLGSAPCGPLPHDAAFSSDGRDVVVAEFFAGRLEIFRLDASGAPVFTGVRIETNYGAHQVVITP